MEIDGLDSLLDALEDLRCADHRTCNMDRTLARGETPCECCGRALNPTTAEQVAGYPVGPDCAQQLRRAGYSWRAR